jgi:PAS domain S-box-containing protein
MSVLTIVWSMWAAASFMLALMHLLLWFKSGPHNVYRLSALMAVSAGAGAMIELMLQQSSSIERYGALLRWENLSVFVLLMAMIWFVYLHFGTARRWLAATITALWSVAIVVNFASPYSVTFADIHALRRLPTFWGESFTVALGPTNPWATLTNLASVLILIYVLDASIRLWRRGERHRAGVIGGAIVLFMVAAGIHTPLVDTGIVQTPYMISFAFLAIVAAMSYDLVSDAVKVSRYAQLIEASEARWRTLLENVQLAVIGVDPEGRISFANPYLVSLTGFPEEGLIGRPLADLLPPSDVPELRRRLAQAAETGPRPHSHWALVCASDEVRELAWSTVRLRDSDGRYAGLLSIGEDITERLRAQRDLRRVEREMARINRANMLGELASALAHELNQPLTAILSNAQTARRHLARDAPDLDELREIIEDVIRDDKRASAVILSLRGLLRGGELARERLAINDAVMEVIYMLQNELTAQHVTVSTELDPSLPMVAARWIEVQQVVMNLLLNAAHAVAIRPMAAREIRVQTQGREDGVRVSVEDNGPGIPADQLPRIFEPFFTTRSEGLGMGLAICRRIVEAHGGRISAANLPAGGAQVRFTLPTLQHPSDD